MPFVARCLEDLFSAGAAKPNPAGSELQQQSAKLVALTPARCLTAHYDVQQSMQVMYRHVPTRSIPHLMAVFLAAYCVARACNTRESFREVVSFSGGPLSMDVGTYNAMLLSVNPFLRSRPCLKDAVRTLHLHPVYKHTGSDDFWNRGKSWWAQGALRCSHVDDKCALLLTALFMLAIRADSMLSFCVDNPSFRFIDMAAFSFFWTAVVLPAKTPFLALRPHVPRNAHTTEQKIVGVGSLLDSLLTPCWLQPALLRDVVEASTPTEWTQSLKRIKRFGGDLVFSHTMEYLQTWDSGLPTTSRVFKTNMTRDVMSEFILNGKNAKTYLSIVNARSQKDHVVTGAITMKILSSAVRDALPSQAVLSDGSVLGFPSFCAVDGQQNSCKAVQAMQTVLTGTHNGKLWQGAVLKRSASHLDALESAQV